VSYSEREDYRYSGSENEDEEHQVAGEPSSIINQAQGGDTLRRNFQQIQVSGFFFFPLFKIPFLYVNVNAFPVSCFL
jgi:hypothetical protein